MNTYIAFLRGINVGGHKKVPMAKLREVISNSGFENIRTYIQSGNVILQSSEDNTSKIESVLQQSIESHFGFEVPVFVKTRTELQTIFETCPFSEEKKENSYFFLLSDIPKQNLVDIVTENTFENEEFVFIKDCLYFYASMGYGNCKFKMNSVEKKLSIKATSRNYKTMVKLLSLSFEN